MEDFKGTLLFISHDRYFINKVCDRVVAIEEKHFENYLGNYDYYRSKKNEACPAIIQSPMVKKDKPVKKNAIENRKPEIDLCKLESSIKSLEAEVSEIDKTMSASGVNHHELNELYCKREELNKELDKLLELILLQG